MNKTRKVRKGPSESATSVPEGTIKDSWVVKKASNGVPRWIPTISAELNGFRLMTVDYAAKHIGKPIVVYCREFKDMWPKKNAWSKPEDSTYYTFKFTPNGDALKGKTMLEGWLKTQKPAVKKGTMFYLDGESMFPLQVDSDGGKLLSVNFMNTEVFVKSL